MCVRALCTGIRRKRLYHRVKQGIWEIFYLHWHILVGFIGSGWIHADFSHIKTSELQLHWFRLIRAWPCKYIKRFNNLVIYTNSLKTSCFRCALKKKKLCLLKAAISTSLCFRTPPSCSDYFSMQKTWSPQYRGRGHLCLPVPVGVAQPKSYWLLISQLWRPAEKRRKGERERDVWTISSFLTHLFCPPPPRGLSVTSISAISTSLQGGSSARGRRPFFLRSDEQSHPGSFLYSAHSRMHHPLARRHPRSKCPRNDKAHSFPERSLTYTHAFTLSLCLSCTFYWLIFVKLRIYCVQL